MLANNIRFCIAVLPGSTGLFHKHVYSNQQMATNPPRQTLPAGWLLY